MKKLLLVLFAFMLTPLLAAAQTPVEREIEQLGFKSVSFKIATPSQVADKAPAAANVDPKMAVDFTHKDVSIIPNTIIDTNVMIFGTITNLSSEPLPIGFVRVQSLPKFWKTSVCFGQNCYTDWVSAVDSSQERWKPNEHRELVLHVRTPPGAQGTGNIELALFPSGSTDTIKVTYTVTMAPVPLTDCRTFWFENPYEGEVMLQSYGIADPDLFDIQLLSDTEYPTSPGDPFAVKFCLKKSDASQYSTKITFVTDSGSFEREITMQTPSAGVRSNDLGHGMRIVSVSPNPANATNQVTVNLESNRASNVELSIVDLLGRELSAQSVMTNAGTSAIKLPIDALTAGSYILLVKEDGKVIDQSSFNVAR